MNIAQMVTDALGEQAAIAYRPATDDDWPEIHRLLRFACEELEERFDTPNTSDPIAWMIRFGISRGEAVFVAESHVGELVGYVAWVGGIPGVAEGTAVGAGTYVLPRYRERGVSAELRGLAVARCRERGYRRVRGEASSRNEGALASVKALGFEVVGVVVELAL